jgi:hypothetical protein
VEVTASEFDSSQTQQRSVCCALMEAEHGRAFRLDFSKNLRLEWDCRTRCSTILTFCLALVQVSLFTVTWLRGRYQPRIGAISICGLGVKGWSVNDCMVTSKALARAVFRPRRVASLPLAWIPSIHRIWQTILSILLDSRYPSRNIEAALKKVFGSSRNISDWSLATEMGLHIGMPVTATND